MRLGEANELERQRRLHGLAVELADTHSVQEVADVLRDVGTIVLGAYRVRLWLTERRVARLVDADRSTTVALTDSAHPVAHVLASAAPLWLPNAAHVALVAAREEAMRAACVLPLLIDGRVIGAIDFAFAESPDYFGPDEVAFLTTLAGQVADAVDRSRLPVIEEWPTGSARIETPMPIAPVLPERLRILVVGRDAHEAARFAEALEVMGHEAVAVYNEHAALRAAEEFAAHVAFVDLELALARDLAAWLRALPGWESTQLIAIGDDATGFDDHLAKPFALEDVAMVLPLTD